MDESGPQFAKKLALYLEQMPLSNHARTELELESEIVKGVREFTKQALVIEAIEKIVYCHGDTPLDKNLWTSSKKLQNVIVYGCSNTSDIFITHPSI